MLGFSSFSETAYGESTTSAGALAFAASAFAQGYVGLFSYDAKANVTPPSATATIIANAFGDVDAQATIAITDAIASISIADLVEIDAQATVIPVAVTAQFTAEAFQDVDAKANTNISNVSADITASAVDFDAKANITNGTVSASFSINDFYDVDAQATITPSSASALFTAADIDFDAKANVTPSSATAVILTEGLADADAQARSFLPSATLQTFVSEFSDVDAQATVVSLSVSATLQNSLADPIAVRFPYDPEAYNRSRTLYLISYDNNNVVHIAPEDYTVYIQKQNGSNTVYIAA